jgi:propionyl-CoA carboxylase alpha chain/3-methylcrotonyl-CoA carboxylase alpha subunit
MLKSVLIANRGEIARRVIRTAKRLGVKTIAVYSEADANSPHVREADEAVLIGPAAAAESYLVQAKILEAAKASGAEAIHPGYGFLSENAGFAEAVAKAGLIWVGPPPSSIRAMGLKDAAKKLMAEAGVPTTPGYLGDDQDPAHLLDQAKAIGFPVLIKAVAGGGGKGMRKVERAEDFDAALGAAKRESKAAFGDDRVLLETYVTRPRHIEVQVFADSHGNAVHLFERDCSLQRRHQKVIEEAPAPGMDEATRAAVCGAAVKAALAVGYVGAGTVEFIADASQGLRADRIWFMEMNTRLQVEHPVTEAITGQDLVEWQLRVASGESLPLRQDELSINGWAMEGRLYAENPATGFLPSTGRLDHFHLPDERIRVDTAVEEGGEVSPFYDPMIAKLIAHAETREAVAAELADACREVEVWPVRTNAAFLARCLDDPDFIAGEVDTAFIETRLERLVPSGLSDAAVLAVVAERLEPLMETEAMGGDVWAPAPSGLLGFRVNAAPAPISMRLFSDGARREVTVRRLGAAGGDWSWDVSMDGRELEAESLPTTYAGEPVLVFDAGNAVEVFANDPSSSGDGAAGAGDGAVRSPMPGKIVAVAVQEGATVRKGAPLVTLEAMKMEHSLTAAFDGVVAELKVKAGDQVSEGVLLVRLEKTEAAAA